MAKRKALDLSLREDRNKFRTSAKWKKFRLGLVDQQNGTCALCGTRYYGKQKKYLQLHHLDPAYYDDLNPEKFQLICSSCHDMVEKMITKIEGSKSISIPRLDAWLDLILDYITVPALEALIAKHPDVRSKEVSGRLNYIILNRYDNTQEKK